MIARTVSLSLMLAAKIEANTAGTLYLILCFGERLDDPHRHVVVRVSLN